MGIFPGRPEGAPHPRQEPRLTGPLTAEGLAEALGRPADLQRRTVWLGGDPEKAAEALSIEGMVRAERAADYVLRPLTRDPRLRALNKRDAMEFILTCGVWNITAKKIETLDEGAAALIAGSLLLLLPGWEGAVSCSAATEEKRAVSAPENEPAMKGALDSFVESLRTNTSLVRRRLRSPLLRVEEVTVGRETATPIDIVYLEGIARPETAEAVRKKLEAMDVDGVLAAAGLEQYLAEEWDTPFPQSFSTQRPDRFCGNLLAGRVGILADGIPLGFLLPVTVGLFLAAEQDRTDNWAVSVCLTVIRYAALLTTLFLPGLYVAAVLFHPETIPLALAESIIKAEEGVPFGALFEAVILLLAFEIIQEAGLRLPGNLGQTVSILGGLIVGSAAVEARIVSPAILIVVAAAGVAGYTVPSPDLAGAVRIWRFALTLAGGLGGFLAVILAGAVLTGHLAGLERYGTPWLSPFSDGAPLFRVPLPRSKNRPSFAGANRRNQR